MRGVGRASVEASMIINPRYLITGVFATGVGNWRDGGR